MYKRQIAVGWRSRAALGVFLVAFVWMELIDAALYLNHYWLMTLLGALLFVLPVGRAWSFDAWTGRVTPSSEVPVWMVWAALSLIHISEPTRLLSSSYAVFCLKKKNKRLYR